MFQNTTANLSALCKSCAKIVCCSSEVDLHVSLCGQQQPKCEPEIRLVYPPFYFNATPHYKRVVSPYNSFKDQRNDVLSHAAERISKLASVLPVRREFKRVNFFVKSPVTSQTVLQRLLHAEPSRRTSLGQPELA